MRLQHIDRLDRILHRACRIDSLDKLSSLDDHFTEEVAVSARGKTEGFTRSCNRQSTHGPMSFDDIDVFAAPIMLERPNLSTSIARDSCSNAAFSPSSSMPKPACI